MIGKISKGAGFRGCINYVLGKPDAKLLVAEGVHISTNLWDIYHSAMHPKTLRE